MLLGLVGRGGRSGARSKGLDFILLLMLAEGRTTLFDYTFGGSLCKCLEGIVGVGMAIELGQGK